MSLIGKTLAHYEITSQLGKGGMGEVYQAKDQKLGRNVAIKVLPEEFARDAERVARFRREAKVLASLNHPAIAAIHGLEESDGTNFLVLELVEGETLADRIKAGPIPVEESVKLALQISEALEAAHDKGVIHRDLKPANISVTPDGKVKVLDFGLAKQLMPDGEIESQAGTLSAITQAGTIAGTIPYMSPEQLQGKLTDARSDLFSFGTLLYEMLTGVHPFSRASAMETVSAILTETPLPLDHYKRRIPNRLRDIVSKLLVKNPIQRCQSAREIKQSLGEILSAGQAGLRYWTFSRPIRIAVALVVLVLGVVLVTSWIRENYFISPQAALAFHERDWILIADFENLTGDHVFDRSLQTALTVGIQQSVYVNVLPQSRVVEALQRMRKENIAKLDEGSACDLAIREGVKAVLACSISEVGGVYSLTARLVEPNKRSTVMSRSVQASKRNEVLKALDSLVSIIRQELGESIRKMSNQSLPLPEATTASLEALKTYTDGMKIKDSDRGAGYQLIKQAASIDPDFALAHANLGIGYYRGGIKDGDRTQGEEHFAKALSLLGRLTLREQLWIRAVVEDERGNSDQATECYRAFLAQYPDDSAGWYRLGWLYMARLGQYEKAIEAYKRVLEIDPSDIRSLLSTGSSYSATGNDEKAIENFEKAFALRPSEITGIYVNRQYGFQLVKMGNLKKAADTFQKMIATENKASGYESIAFLAMYQGKLSDAIANFKEAILILKAEKDVEGEYRGHMFLASAYRLKGRNVDLASELAIANRILSQAPLEPWFISILAKNYARIGKTGEASRLLENMTLQAKNLTALSAVNRTSRGDEAAISLVKGEISLANGRRNEAIDFLKQSLQLEGEDMGSLESLAFAYRKIGKPQEAARKYQEISAILSLGREAQEYWILAHYELAKIYLELGDAQKAKVYYEKLFHIWKDADPDIPVLLQAKAEYAALR